MLELSSIIILLVGLGGVAVIVFRKIPILSELPVEEKTNNLKISEVIKQKAENSNFLKLFSGEILLQKILSKIRILTLKTDNKTSVWLSKLRQRAIKKKENFSDNYWEKIKRK